MEIRDIGDCKKYDKRIAERLLQLQLIEKRGKTNAQFYILSRRYYELADNLVAYSTLIDWDINQVWSVICPYLENYGKANKSDFVGLL